MSGFGPGFRRVALISNTRGAHFGFFVSSNTIGVTAMHYVLSENVRVLDDDEQVIIMDVKRGRFYCCNQSAALILDSVRAKHHFDAIVGRIKESFEHPSANVRDEVQRFINTLIRYQLCDPLP